MSSTVEHAPYTHSLDKCDVQDKTKLAHFRKVRAEWVNLNRPGFAGGCLV